MSLRPPSGTTPPSESWIDGTRVDLIELAAEVCRRYYETYDDERDRYGETGVEWCLHDNRWLLSWAIDDVIGATDLTEQVAWLARVLHEREFPVDRLAADLRIAADTIGERFGEAAASAAAGLRRAAGHVDELIAAGF